MRNSSLREKDRIVLNVIVEHYLKIGKPVSSGLIHQKGMLADSPATFPGSRNSSSRRPEALM